MQTAKCGRNSSPAADKRGGGWADLSNDLLVAIFSRIGVADLIAGVPYVCSSWRQAAKNPFCWRVLDFHCWDAISHRLDCRRDKAADFADLFNFAITRSEEIVHSVHFPNFANANDLAFVTNRCPMLQYFSMENPYISETGFCKAIGKLGCLKGMAVDESLICHKILQHVNQCCGDFSELKVFSDTVDREMASVICECLPHLRKVEITACLMLRGAIFPLLDGLKELEFLDVSGDEICITSEVIEKASHLKAFRWYSKFDLGEFELCYRCGCYFRQAPCECGGIS